MAKDKDKGREAQAGGAAAAEGAQGGARKEVALRAAKADGTPAAAPPARLAVQYRDKIVPT